MTTMIKAETARTLRYSFVALPDEAEADGYHIVFPDLPGVTSWAPSLDAIAENVREVLELEFEGAAEDSLLAPAPSGYPDDESVRWGQEQAPMRDPDVPVMTAAEVGERLGITAQAVNLIARKRGLGWIVGRQRVFAANHVEEMKDRPGRGLPRKPVSVST